MSDIKDRGKSEGRKYYHTDIESGETYEVSKEQKEAIEKLWDIAKPKLDNIKGRILVFGTGGAIDNDNQELEKLFSDPKNYEIIKWNKDEQIKDI